MYTYGKITEIKDGQGFMVYVPFEHTYLLDKRQIKGAEVRIDDGRTISGEQRKKIYATLRDIATWNGDTPEYLKEYFKAEYIAEIGEPYFSLSDCSMTTARNFLEMLLEFCLRWDIPTLNNLAERAPDIGKYVYLCLAYKKCCVSQKTGAQLHHVDRVGMGRDRRQIVHAGMLTMPLLPEYHDELHRIGQQSFEEKYKVFGVKLDEYLCKIWNLKS